MSLINNILDLNKLEANKVEVEYTSFNLKKRVDDVIFALTGSAKEKGNSLDLDYNSSIPDQLMGDPLMVSQILINLIGNANKFTRDGQIFIRIELISQNDNQIYLHFEVEDTGEGISKKNKRTSFRILHRVLYRSIENLVAPVLVYPSFGVCWIYKTVP